MLFIFNQPNIFSQANEENKTSDTNVASVLKKKIESKHHNENLAIEGKFIDMCSFGLNISHRFILMQYVIVTIVTVYSVNSHIRCFRCSKPNLKNGC